MKKELIPVTCENTYEEQRDRFQAAVESYNSVFRRLVALGKACKGEYPNAIVNHTLEQHELWGLRNIFDYFTAVLQIKFRLQNPPSTQEPEDERTKYGKVAGGWKCQEKACDCLYCELGDLPDKETVTAEDIMILDNSAYKQTMRTYQDSKEQLPAW
ncbi:hypothetical protein F4775DRAFT_561306 [Biscogniauxia sp. FL1348]|nr:hypothetical protein F4775DRAFT_561306 [Biscogniauxia sp. FL1348]